MPIKSENAKTAVIILLHPWIVKFGPPSYLVTHRGSKYINVVMAQRCTIMGIRHSHKKRQAVWIIGLFATQNETLGTLSL